MSSPLQKVLLRTTSARISISPSLQPTGPCTAVDPSATYRNGASIAAESFSRAWTFVRRLLTLLAPRARFQPRAHAPPVDLLHADKDVRAIDCAAGATSATAAPFGHADRFRSAETVAARRLEGPQPCGQGSAMSKGKPKAYISIESAASAVRLVSMGCGVPRIRLARPLNSALEVQRTSYIGMCPPRYYI